MSLMPALDVDFIFVYFASDAFSVDTKNIEQ